MCLQEISEEMQSVLDDIAGIADCISSDASEQAIDLQVFIKDSRDALSELEDLLDELADMDEAI